MGLATSSRGESLGDLRQKRRDAIANHEHPVVTLIYVLAAIAAILTFLFSTDFVDLSDFSPFGGNGSGFCSDPQVSLSAGAGPSGTEVNVTGSGFPADEDVELRFHTELLTPTRTDDSGHFEVTIRVPGSFDAFAPQQFEINARAAACSIQSPFQLTR
jgi:hypothetical protein